MRRFALLLLIVVANRLPVAAQVVGRTARDTLRPPAASPIAFEQPRGGLVLTDSLPALTPALDLADLLQPVPGSFTYLFDLQGWPDGWSLDGLPPQSTGLTLNGIPFDYVFTGQPAYQLVPVTLLERPRLVLNRQGRFASVETALRPFATPRPITEGTYWRGGDGLQSIAAVHAQHRRRALFGNPGFLNVAGSYGGRAADGEYPNSDLRRGRQVLLRLRYEQVDWSVEVLNLHNRRRVGAHGGVVPDGDDFESVYRRAAAVVENPEADRRTIRNDLALTVRTRVLGGQALTVGAFWTAESRRYSSPDVLLEAVSDRLGLRAALPIVTSETHTLTAHVEGWSDAIDPRHGFTPDPVRMNRIHASLRDSLRTGGVRFRGSAGIDRLGSAVLPSAALSAEAGSGLLSFRGSVSLSNRPAAAVDRLGFGALTGLAGVETAGRLLHARGRLLYRAGPFEMQLGAFAAFESDPIDYFAVGEDSAAVREIPGSLRRAGGFAELAWRKHADRGFYWIVSPTLLRFLNADGSDLHQRVAESLPKIFGRMRLGARYLLFRGDLDLDLYVQASAWSELRGRTFLPESGLLAIADRMGRVLGPSSILDVVVEARVRDARFYLMYENALSGTELMIGNMIVPLYPLPARRFRFGVYWPIFG